jgi:hypothetical protein
MSYAWTKGISFSAGSGNDCATAIYALKTALVAAGWTVPSSGSGTSGSYSSSTDLITSAAVLNSAKAWFRLAAPGGGREWCFQRDATYPMYWRVKYTPSAGFVAGSPAKDVTPSAAIECVLCGGGTDASPTMSYAFGLYGGSTAPYLAHIVADNASPYGFCMWGYRTDTWAPIVRFFMDPLLAGTYPGSDPDPYVVCCEIANGGAGWGYVGTAGNGEVANNGMRACFGTPAVSANYVTVGIPVMRAYNTSNKTMPAGIGTNPYSFKDESPRAMYIRRAGAGSPNGYKGLSSMFRATGPFRGLGETGSKASSRDYIRCGDLLLPWDGNPGVT